MGEIYCLLCLGGRGVTSRPGTAGPATAQRPVTPQTDHLDVNCPWPEHDGLKLWYKEGLLLQEIDAIGFILFCSLSQNLEKRVQFSETRDSNLRIQYQQHHSTNCVVWSKSIFPNPVSHPGNEKRKGQYPYFAVAGKFIMLLFLYCLLSARLCSSH